MSRPPLAALLWRVGLGGALGGALYATDFLLSLGGELPAVFRRYWHVIPAGVAHGALLAIVAALVTWLVVDRGLRIRILAVPLAGWVGGFLSWVPVGHSLGEQWDLSTNLLWAPFVSFGLVSALAVLAGC